MTVVQATPFDALYIPANDTPWFPYGPSGCEVQLIQADPTTGQWIVKLQGSCGGQPRHSSALRVGARHHAQRRLAFCRTRLGGAHGQYHCHQTPGSVHTLVLDDESEILFVVQGALEYLDAEGRTLAHEDWRSIADKHTTFCKERGLSSVDVTRPRLPSVDRVLAQEAATTTRGTRDSRATCVRIVQRSRQTARRGAPPRTRATMHFEARTTYRALRWLLHSGGWPIMIAKLDAATARTYGEM